MCKKCSTPIIKATTEQAMFCCNARLIGHLIPPLTTHTTFATLSSSSSSFYPKSDKTLFSHNHSLLSTTTTTTTRERSSSWVGVVCRVQTMSSSNGTGGDDGGTFKLSDSSVLKIKKGDITQWFVDGSSDAIVNPANEKMLGGGGADGAIHKAAGPELKEACFKVPEVRPGIRCPTGEARITPGFKLPASHVIHTVGPIYEAYSNPEAILRSSYKNSLSVAKENNIRYIAFPAISCGVYGYPFEEAARVSISTVKEFSNDIKEVHFVLFSDDIYSVWLKKAKELLQAQA